jgi:hypothetical protein
MAPTFRAISMRLGKIVTGRPNDGAHSGRAGAVIADIALVEQLMESAGNHSLEKRIFVRVVVIKRGAIDSCSFGDILDGDFIEIIALHEFTQRTLKKLARSPHSWIAHFAVGNRHGSLLSLEGNKEKKNPKNDTRRLIRNDKSCLSVCCRRRRLDHADPLTPGFKSTGKLDQPGIDT